MIDFKKIEEKWQKRWEKSKIFQVKESTKKKKFYCLEMYPYPSAYGLHMGHVRNYAIGDCYSRFKRMQGFNVLYPMGYDSFGLPAENAAIQEKIHPKKYTEKAIESIIKNQKELGLSYDWSRLISTHKEDYYKWNQLLFLRFFDKGLAYKKKAPINYCPKCKTVLANEQVEQGKCWRCKTEVIVKELEQWFFKITNYAEELLKDLDKLKGWPETIKTMQENWIGKSYGTEIKFKIKNTNEIIPIFTTRPDTLFGVTFMVFAPENPLVSKWVKGTKYEKPFKTFLKEVQKENKFERTDIEVEKKGLFIGKYAINPINNEEVPVYIGNFVIYEYGAGAVMAVPAHDQRDFEFAKKYKIPIKIVITPKNYELKPEKMTRAYLEEGVLINSDIFNSMNSKDAIEEITKFLEKKKLGKSTISYKLRDWLISRQRYWGTPIPIIYCDKCGIVKVPEKDLPVKLPENIKFTGQGNPLEKSKTFVEVKCPKCKSKAKRETDTMDTFVDSSWYFLRYCSPKENKQPFNKNKVKYWLPVDQYIGGAEHAVMHLLYARFFTKVLRDLELINFNEPFTKLFNQGILYKDGHKMSKSFGNVVGQEEIAKKYGIDTARLFLLFVASPDKTMEWSQKGIEGSFRFVNRVYNLLNKKITSKKDKKIENKLNSTIKKVTEYISNFEMSKAIIDIMGYVDYLTSKEEIPKKSLETLSIILSPFCPHICEEIYETLGNKNFVSTEKWPKPGKIDSTLEQEEILIEKTKNDIRSILKLIKIKPKKLYIYCIPKEKITFDKASEYIAKELGINTKVFSVSDKKKYDPENKSKKAKPNRPALFFE